MTNDEKLPRAFSSFVIRHSSFHFPVARFFHWSERVSM